jgi:hypothetical protein
MCIQIPIIIFHANLLGGSRDDTCWRTDGRTWLAYANTTITNLDDWLTVHHSTTLVDFQLKAQNSYLFIYNILIKILYMFRTLPCSSLGGLRPNCIYMQLLVSPLSTGECLVHRLRKNCFLNRCTIQSPVESGDTRSCIYIQLGRRPPEDEQGNARNI